MLPNPKKILYIHPVSGQGGALQALLCLINNLDKSQYYPKVLCPEHGDSYETFKKNEIDVEIERGIKIFGHATAGWYPLTRVHKFIKAFFGIFYSAWAMRKRINKEKPDIVHLSSSVLLGSAIGAKTAKVPIVWHIREYLHDGYFGIRKRLITAFIERLSDVIIVISKTDANRLRPSNKIHVIYDSVDFSKFNRYLDSNKFKKEFKMAENQPSVGMFGGISKIKGTLEFIQAAKLILKEKTNMKFFIFGASRRSNNSKIINLIKRILFIENYYNKIKKELDNDKLFKQIIFQENRKDVPSIMASLDIIVFPSTASHSALPTIEAGAMAKPVIASNWGEIEEEVIHNETGILVEPANPIILSQAIESLLNNSELAKELGEQGYIRARQNFDIKLNVKEILHIYDKILS